MQGTATAAGCQLVAACDLAVAAEGWTFATPGVRIGLFCTTPMVPPWPAGESPAKPALEMLLTGRPISARLALEAGLVNRVVPGGGPRRRPCRSSWTQILAASPLTIRLGKRAFYEQPALDEADFLLNWPPP